MQPLNRLKCAFAALAVGTAALTSAAASAAEVNMYDGQWHYDLYVYGWLPAITTDLNFTLRNGATVSPSVTVKPHYGRPSSVRWGRAHARATGRVHRSFMWTFRRSQPKVRTLRREANHAADRHQRQHRCQGDYLDAGTATRCAATGQARPHCRSALWRIEKVRSEPALDRRHLRKIGGHQRQHRRLDRLHRREGCGAPER